MIIANVREKCKSLVASAPRDVIIVAILVLASSASFGLGFLAGRDAGQGSCLADDPLETTSSITGKFVASKNGTKYYLPECAGAGRISDTNKVWFATAAAAVAAGYAPASNCDGM